MKTVFSILPAGGRKPVWRAGFFFLLWGLIAMAGFYFLVRFEVTAGASSAGLEQWSADVPVKFDASRTNLVMLAHPKCPCTKASLAELTRVLTRTRGAVSASILFYTPKDAGADWESEPLWAAARRIPGVQVAADPEGVWAVRLGAETSGHVVLFDRKGQLVFRGGITGARGHEGDNAGEARVVALALAGSGSAASAAVFGCPIDSPQTASVRQP